MFVVVVLLVSLVFLLEKTLPIFHLKSVAESTP